MLDRDKLLKLASMSRISLNESEIEIMQENLNSIIDYLNILDEIDTEGVEPTYQVSGIENVTFDDEILNPTVTSDELLNCSKFPITDHQITTNSILN